MKVRVIEPFGCWNAGDTVECDPPVGKKWLGQGKVEILESVESVPDAPDEKALDEPPESKHVTRKRASRKAE